MIQSKTRTWSAVNFKKKHATSMRCRLEPTIWSRGTGQQILCFDRCQLIITWMSNIKGVHGKPRLCVSVNLLYMWSMAAMLHDSTVVRMRPWAIPLPMITMRKSIHGFLFPYMVMGLRLAALWAAQALLQRDLTHDVRDTCKFFLAVGINLSKKIIVKKFKEMTLPEHQFK